RGVRIGCRGGSPGASGSQGTPNQRSRPMNVVRIANELGIGRRVSTSCGNRLLSDQRDLAGGLLTRRPGLPALSKLPAFSACACFVLAKSHRKSFEACGEPVELREIKCVTARRDWDRGVVIHRRFHPSIAPAARMIG